MKKNFLFSILCIIPFWGYSQTYQELYEEALAFTEIDSLYRAENLFKEAMRLEPANPHNAMLFSNVGTLQRRMNRYEEAVESFTFALNMAPNAIPVLLNRASVFMELGNTNRAYVDYCQVLDLDKVNTESLLMRAYIYIIRRDYNAARLDYKRLLEIEPFSYSGRLGLVTLEQKEKKYEAAINLLNNMIIENPSDAILYIMRAGVEVNMLQDDAALVDLERAIELQPEAADSYLLRGQINLSRKKKGLAKQDFEKALSLGVPSSELRELLQQCR